MNLIFLNSIYYFIFPWKYLSTLSLSFYPFFSHSSKNHSVLLTFEWKYIVILNDFMTRESIIKSNLYRETNKMKLKNPVHVTGSVCGLGTVPRLPPIQARAYARPWQRVHPTSPLLSTTRCTGTRTDPMRRSLRLWHFHFVGASMQIAALHYTHLKLDT